MTARVLKFGGTSLADAGRIRAVAEIVRRAVSEPDGKGPVVVVVSALGGTTDTLERLALGVGAAAAAGAQAGTSGTSGLADGSAGSGDSPEAGGREDRAEGREDRAGGRKDRAEGDGSGDSLRELDARHRRTIRELGLARGPGSVVDAEVSAILARLEELFRGAELVGEASPRTRDGILATGELLSAAIVLASLRGAGLDARGVDARDLIVTDGRFGRASVDAAATEANVVRRLGSQRGVTVVPGFVGATVEGWTTTLGRGGSDYTAALIGAALGSEIIEIWTDVDGVMSADPRRVPDAFSLRELSYDELIELSHFGAKVVYAPTVHPARAKGLSLLIRNAADPGAPGTRISEDVPPPPASHPLRGVTSLAEVALLRLEGDAMYGRATIAERLFRALGSEEIRLLMVSQSSSGHTISFAIDLDDLDRARGAVAREFELERRAGWIDELDVQDDCCCMAVVGSGMQRVAGVAGRLFGTLGQAGINVRAIAQGSSELNISFIIERSDEDRALRAVHRAFFADASSGRTAPDGLEAA